MSLFAGFSNFCPTNHLNLGYYNDCRCHYRQICIFAEMQDVTQSWMGGGTRQGILRIKTNKKLDNAWIRDCGQHEIILISSISTHPMCHLGELQFMHRSYFPPRKRLVCVYLVKEKVSFIAFSS